MKLKTSLIILALAAVTVITLAVVARPPADSFESFSLVMDRLSGPDQWSAQSYEESAGGLTVKGLAFSLIGLTGEEEWGGPVTLDSVFIKKLPSKNRLGKILALADWLNQPETRLAQTVRLEGFHWRETRPEGDEIKIAELNLEGLKLARTAPDDPAGEEGFRKALRLDALDYKDFRLTANKPEAETSVVVDSAAFEKLTFNSDVPPELAQPGLLHPWAAMNAKSLQAEGLKVEFLGRSPEAPARAGLSLAALKATDLMAFKAVSALKLADFQGRLTSGQGREFSLNLADLSLSGLDLADYLGKFLAGLAEARNNPEGAEALIAGQFTLADFFVSPISLTEAALTGLEMDLAGLALIKAAEIKTVGPYRAGEIPASAKSWTTGLAVSLSGDAQAAPGTPDRDIYEFSQMLGRTDFTLEAVTDSSYEPGAGQWTASLSRLAVPELFNLSLSQTWSGLTGDRLQKFKNMPLAVIYLAALDPDGLLGDTSLNALNLKYTDLGLVDALFNFQAQAEEGATGAELKQRTMAEMGMMLAVTGDRYLKNPEDLSRPLLAFLNSPQSLEIDMKAAPPLTFAGLQSLDDEPSLVLDALNLTFSANGQAGSPLRFVSGLGDPGLERPDDNEGGE
jgi:hypothetical protein